MSYFYRAATGVATRVATRVAQGPALGGLRLGIRGGVTTAPLLRHMNTMRPLAIASRSGAALPPPKALARAGLPQNVPQLRHMSVAQPEKPPSGLAHLLREYGRIALAIYLTLTAIVFGGCYASIVLFNVDVAGLLRWARRITERLTGTSAPAPPPDEVMADTAKTDSTAQRSLVATLLLTVAMTKLFSPFKLMVTAGVTPLVARKLRQAGFEVGSRRVRDAVAKSAGRP